MSVINSTASLSTFAVQDPFVYKLLVYLDDGTISGDGNAVAVRRSDNTVVLSTSAHIFKNFRTFDTSRIRRVVLSNPDTGVTFEVGFDSVVLHPEWRGIVDNRVDSLFDGGRDLAVIVIPAGISVPGIEPYRGNVRSLVGNVIQNISRGPGGTLSEPRPSGDFRALAGTNRFDDDGARLESKYPAAQIGKIIATDFDTVSGDPLASDALPSNPVPTPGEVQLINGDSGSIWLFNGQLLGHASFAYRNFGVTVSSVLDIAFLESVPGDNTTNTPPSVTMPSSILVNENQQLVAAIVASDVNNDPLTFALQGADAGLFNITNGNIQFVNAPDFEAARTTYEIALSVSDGVNQAVVVPVTVVVSNVNEAPSVLAGISFTIPESAVDGTVVGTVTVQDPDANDQVTLSGSLPPGLSFQGRDIVVQSRQNIVPGNYPVQVVATDAGGLSATGIVNVTVTRENKPPIVQLPQSVTVPENERVVFAVVASDGDNDPLIISLQGNDANDFTVLNGQVQFVNPPDFETDKRQYQIAVVVSDGKNTPVSTPVEVNVSDVNEAPFVVPGLSFTLTNNFADGAVVGVVTAQDPDANESLLFSGTLPGGLAWNGNSIVVDSSRELQVGEYSVPVVVRDRGGLTGSADVAISILQANRAPQLVIPEMVTIPENTSLVALFEVGDPDGDEVSVTLGGPDKDLFRVNGNRLEWVTPQDFEKNPGPISLTISATDGELSSPVTELVVRTSDVNEAPVFGGSLFSFNLGSVRNGSVIGRLTATDPENDRLVASGNLPSGLGFRGLDIIVTDVMKLHAGSFDVRTKVSDPEGLFAEASVKITIDKNLSRYFSGTGRADTVIAGRDVRKTGSTILTLGGDDYVDTSAGSKNQIHLGAGNDFATVGRHDVVYGESGKDTLLNLDGAGMLAGGSGDDILFGGRGSRLYGDRGDDRLVLQGSHAWGGSGRDTFTVNPSCGISAEIHDFQRGYDSILIHGVSQGANSMGLEFDYFGCNTFVYLPGGTDPILKVNGFVSGADVQLF